MKTIRKIWESLVFSVFPPFKMLPPGSYHFQTPPEATEQYRLHLRINPAGDGLFIINAATVLHLNQTAAEYAYHVVNQTPPEEAARRVSQRYHVPFHQAQQDLNDLKERIEVLIHQQDLDPITFLDLEEQNTYTADLAAPLRLDCALTYLSDGLATPGLAPSERVKSELNTQQWMRILDKGWQVGIPQVVFTGGEPTLRPDLKDLIGYAEKLGMITGLLTNGLALTESEALNQLLLAGLDHMMLLLDPASPQSWQAVKTAVAADIFLTVHVTVDSPDTAAVKNTLQMLVDNGVKNVSLSAASLELHSAIEAARHGAASLGLRLISDLPVPYSRFHPVALEMGGSTELSPGSGSKWLYVEPDGDVLPGQGILQVMGNLLTDPWEVIWNNRPKG